MNIPLSKTKSIVHLLFLISLVITLSLGQLQRTYLSSSLSFYIHDLILVTWLIFSFFTERENLINSLKKQLSQIHSIDKKLVIVFAAIITIGLLAAASRGLSLIKPLLYIGRLFLYLLGAYNAWLMTHAQKIFETKDNQYIVVCFGLLVMLYGFCQYIFFPDLRFLAILGWDDHYFRLVSTIFDPTFTGLILVMTFILWQSFNLTNKKSLSIVVSILIMGALALTFSRSSFLSFIISTMILLIKVKPKRLLLISYMFICCLFVAITPKPRGEGVNLLRTASIEAKQENTNQQLSQLNMESILIGTGAFTSAQPNHYQIQLIEVPYHAQLPDNLYLAILVQTGIGGLAISLYFIGKVIRFFNRKNLYLLASFVAILVHSLFTPSLVQPFVLLYMLLASATFKI